MIKEDTHCQPLCPPPHTHTQLCIRFVFLPSLPGKDHPKIQSNSHPSVVSTKTVLAICSLGRFTVHSVCSLTLKPPPTLFPGSWQASRSGDKRCWLSLSGSFKKFPFWMCWPCFLWLFRAPPALTVQILSRIHYCLTPRCFLSVKANLCFQEESTFFFGGLFLKIAWDFNSRGKLSCIPKKRNKQAQKTSERTPSCLHTPWQTYNCIQPSWLMLMFPGWKWQDIVEGQSLNEPLRDHLGY